MAVMLTRPAPSRPRPRPSRPWHQGKGQGQNRTNEKSAQRRRKHCVLAVVRRTHKQTHVRGRLQSTAQLSAQCNKAYNADITLVSVQLFAFIKWQLPVLRLTEVTMTGNSLRLAGKILVFVKLIALTIYAKAGLLRPIAKDFASRARPRTNITG